MMRRYAYAHRRTGRPEIVWSYFREDKNPALIPTGDELKLGKDTEIDKNGQLIKLS